MALLPSNTFIDIDRDEKTLKVSKRSLLSTRFVPGKSYGIAIGMKGVETPKGVYVVLRRDDDPTWTIPDSDWARVAGLTPGTTLADDDPNNPIVGRWIELWGPGSEGGIKSEEGDYGIGIHGTHSLDSIGTAASHGCIRMRPEDVKDLFPQVRKGTIVHIA